MVNRIVLNEVSYHGKGAVKELVSIVNKLNAKKALVVTDSDLLKFKVANKVTDLLDENNLEYEIFSDIQPNPTITNVKKWSKSF